MLMPNFFRRLPIVSLALLPSLASAQVTNDELPFDNTRGRFIMYGVAPMKPVVFPPIRKMFYITNQMGDRLAVYSSMTGQLLSEVPTGSGLVSLALRPGTNELWMVDRVTNSLTVLDTDSSQIIRTVRVGAEPHDIVFTPNGARAYVSCSAVNRVDIVDTQNYRVVKSIDIPARQPRGLAMSGDSVYVVPMMSGNGTAPIGDSALGEPDRVVHVADIPGANELPDRDLFRIAITDSPGTDFLDSTGTLSGLGTTLFNLHARPGTGELWIPNTEALNAEHRGERNFPAGQVVRNRITVVDTSQNPATVRFVDLDELAPSIALRTSVPTSVSFSPDGSRAFVTGYGTDSVAVLDVTSNGNVTWAGYIQVEAVRLYPEFSGPRGSAVSPDGRYLVTYNKVDNSFARIDLTTLPTSTPFVFDYEDARHIGYDRMAAALKRGRGFFDSTLTSASNTSACFSCHTDGDTDGLTWDLSEYLDPEGTPNDELQFGVDIKGPMVSQSVRALREIGPYHWRGERDRLRQFNGTFRNLFEHTENGEPSTIGGGFFYIEQYLEELAIAPNPKQPLDRQYTPAQLAGADIFLNKPVQNGQSCGSCHTLPLGTNNEIVQTFRGGDSPTIVVPQLRAVQRKLNQPIDLGATFGMRTELGAGLNHAGSAADIQSVAMELDEGGDPLFLVSSGEANRLADFIEALDTGLAPSTGYQVTMHADNVDEVVAGDLAFLMSQADDGHCDLVYITGPEYLLDRSAFATGTYLPRTGTFAQGSVTLPDLTVPQMVAKAMQGRPVTFIGVAGLRGKVMGIDRDNDGMRDLDEQAAGTDFEVHDTDDDGFPDGYELTWGLDPLVPDSSVPDNAAPVLVDQPKVIYTTQTSIKVEFETNEPSRVFFYVDGQAVFRRPLDHEFDTVFSHPIGGLDPDTVHTISLEVTDPADNVSIFDFDHESASFVRQVPVHVEEIRARLIRDVNGAPGAFMNLSVRLGDGETPAAAGYDVEVSVYHSTELLTRLISAERHATSMANGRANFGVPIPTSITAGSGQLVIVVQEVTPPPGRPSYVEANNELTVLEHPY